MTKCKILMTLSHGWSINKIDNINIWFKGYLINNNKEDFFASLKSIISKENLLLKDIEEYIKSTNGHYAIVVQKGNFIFSAVDRIKSIPIYYTNIGDDYIISNSSVDIKKTHKSNIKVNSQSILEVAMSGYTIGRKTIYKNILQLMAGECLFFQENDFSIKNYYNFLPFNKAERDEDLLSTIFSDTMITIMKNVISSCEGRQIVVPLSAGKDSRLIVSALYKLNYKNVKCFSYGVKKSSDMVIGEKISKALGYKWKGIVTTRKKHQEVFYSKIFKQYKDDFETMSSTPFYQDFFAVLQLKNSGWVDDDAVFINGNTGDFLSGGHIANKLIKGDKSDLYSVYLDKHYSEWKKLRNEVNDSIINYNLDLLFKERFKCNMDRIPISSIYESFEWLGRQSKHIVMMQRCYEFFGYDWRMPLWDNRLMDFWEQVPVEYKYKQKLYKYTLIRENWGKVWKGIAINPKDNRPTPIVILRFFFKAVFLFIGRKKWHKFDDKYFKYFLSPTNDYFMLGYFQWALDSRGARDARSWRIKEYLEHHNINIDNLD